VLATGPENGAYAEFGKRYVEELKRFGIRVDYHAGNMARRFPDEVETAAYRAVQEGLTNVLRHAAASTVSVVLASHEDNLQVIIDDNGRGFDVEAAAAKGRLGLAGITERLALVKGTLSIDSSPGAGTTLYIRIPLPEDEESGNPLQTGRD